jgi:hypothetical protein
MSSVGAINSGYTDVSKALLQARLEDWRWPGLFKSVIGLLFLGTPFKGTHNMLHTEILDHAETRFGSSNVMHENHRASKADNDWLRDLVNDFCLQMRQEAAMPKIACFYEEKPTDLGLFLKDKVGSGSRIMNVSDVELGRI